MNKIYTTNEDLMTNKLAEFLPPEDIDSKDWHKLLLQPAR